MKDTNHDTLRQAAEFVALLLDAGALDSCLGAWERGEWEREGRGEPPHALQEQRRQRALAITRALGRLGLAADAAVDVADEPPAITHLRRWVLGISHREPTPPPARAARTISNGIAAAIAGVRR